MQAAGEPVSADVGTPAGSGRRRVVPQPRPRVLRSCNSGAYRRDRRGRRHRARGRISARRNGVVRQNPGASLVDLGDGVACLELHSKKNAIGEDIVRLVTETLSPDSDAVRNFEAFVISGDAEQFLRRRQPDATAAERPGRRMGRRRSRRPRLPAHDRRPSSSARARWWWRRSDSASAAARRSRCTRARRQAHAELYMGLVETGVGLLPAGGGCKEMTLRALDACSGPRGRRSESVELLDALRRNFETIAMAKVSTSAVEARQLGMLLAGRPHHHESRAAAERRQADWPANWQPTGTLRPGAAHRYSRARREPAGTLKLGVHMMREGEFISDHDVKVANRVAHVLCGGKSRPERRSANSICWIWSGRHSSRCAGEENPGADRVSR